MGDGRELDKYICQIALSRLDFISKYEGKEGMTAKCLRYHRSFRSRLYWHSVADTVEIITKSYTMRRRCVGSSPRVSGVPSVRTERGTTVILHEEESEFLSEFKLRDILDKYCAFMPVEIYFTDESKRKKAKIKRRRR